MNLSMEDIAIISRMRIRIMSFTICKLFELFQRWYDVTTWQFNLFFLQQVIKDPITLSNIKRVAYFVLSAFRSRLQARAYKWFRFRPPASFGYTHVSLFVVRQLATILDHVNMMLIPRLIASPREVPRLFGSTFTI
jgi:hypothetical protein